MPGKSFRKKNHENKALSAFLILKQEGQSYGIIKKSLGDRRLEVLCDDNKQRICNIPGKFRKSMWMSVNDIVLVNLRSYQDDKADISYKYSTTDIRKLIKTKEFDPKIFQEDKGEEEEDIMKIESSDDEEDLDNI